MHVSNKAGVFFGITLVASGLSQLVYSLIFSESVWLIFAALGLSSGVVVAAFSFFRAVGLSKRPLGITISGVSFSLVGFVAVFIGIWLFWPSFLLAVGYFTVSLGLLEGKTWARQLALLTTGFSLLASVLVSVLSMFIPLLEPFPLVPSVLSNVYLLWYLYRPHVSDFFVGEEDKKIRMLYTETDKHPRHLITACVSLLVLALLLTYLYFTPPNDHVIFQDVTSRGTQGSGELGSPAYGSTVGFFASRGDLLNYSFKTLAAMPTQEAHFWLTEEINGTERLTLVEEIGSEGSGFLFVPQTGKHAVWVGVHEYGQITVRCDVQVTSFSLRRLILQLLFLSIYGVAATLFGRFQQRDRPSSHRELCKA